MRLVFLFLLTQMAFSQVKETTLENRIYNAIDVFTANPNTESLKKLEVQEVKFQPKTRAEILALVILNCNKAYYENQFGQTKKAISTYEKAWLHYQKNKLSNYDISEFCLKPLGNLYTIIGDYENAENTIKQYYYIANVADNEAQKFAAILNLSNVYQNSGKIDEAIRLLEKTIQSEKLSGVQKGILYTNLGNNYFLTTENAQILKGENAYKKAIALLKLEKNQSESLSNAYRNLAKRYVIAQNYELASSYMQNARIEFMKIPKQEPRKTAQFYLDEATILLKRDSLKQCEKRIQIIFRVLLPTYTAKKILPDENSLYAETTLLDALDLQAALFIKQNLPQKALQSYQLAFHVEEMFQSLLVYENSKIISQIRNRNRTELCLSIYYNLYQIEKKQRYIESAFLLQEQTKSAVLKEYLSNSKTITGDEKLIREQLQNWNTLLIKEQQKLDLADISKINEAIKKQNELMLLLKSATQDKSKIPKKEIKLTDLFSKLKQENACMVVYFFGRSKIYTFILQDNIFTLNERSLEKSGGTKIRDFIDCFSDSEKITNNSSRYQTLANEVYKNLNLPKNSQQKNLIIIPDGILTFLPFEALITKKSSTSNFAKMHYLLRDFKIDYNNSASFYLNSTPFKHTNETILGVFPIFENSTLELAFSMKELDYLKANFKGTYLEKEQASFGNFKQNAKSFSILHLSTHATSGDMVEPASIRFYDQEILYSQLYNLSIDPDLVVLSACETGVGKLYKSEGAQSIARGFQFAGAQNLLFSLWRVNDFTTSVLMEQFYKNIGKGKSYFDSNHQAKLDFLADTSISNSKKSPYYWSSFVYYGTLDNKPSQSYFSAVLIAVILSIGLFLLFKKMQHGRISKNIKEKQL